MAISARQQAGDALRRSPDRRPGRIAVATVLASLTMLAALALATVASASSLPSLIAFKTGNYGGGAKIWYVQDGHPTPATPIYATTQGGADVSNPAWSPNGEALAFVVGGNSIALASRSGSIFATLPEPITPLDMGIAWSPNGHEIAYVCTAGTLLTIQYPSPAPPVDFGPNVWPNVCVLNLVSGVSRVLTESTMADAIDTGAPQLSWSRAGNEIAIDSQTDILPAAENFCANNHQSNTIAANPAGAPCDLPHISLIDVATGVMTPIGSDFMGSPAFSPDGGEIAFADGSGSSPGEPARRHVGVGRRRARHPRAGRHEPQSQPDLVPERQADRVRLLQPGAR